MKICIYVWMIFAILVNANIIVRALMQDLWLIIVLLVKKCGSLLLYYDDHCRVKCVMDFNVNYVNVTTGSNEHYSKPAWV